MLSRSIIQSPAQVAIFGLQDGVEAEIGVGEGVGGEGGGVAVGEEEVGLGVFVVAGGDAVGVGAVDVHEDAVEEENQVGGALHGGELFQTVVGIDAISGNA